MTHRAKCPACNGTGILHVTQHVLSLLVHDKPAMFLCGMPVTDGIPSISLTSRERAALERAITAILTKRYTTPCGGCLNNLRLIRDRVKRRADVKRARAAAHEELAAWRARAKAPTPKREANSSAVIRTDRAAKDPRQIAANARDAAKRSRRA